jgi:ribosomal protein S18 acetylase RimI-like enzyme
LSFTVRPLAFSDFPAIRTLRLEALAAHPSAYGASYEDESREPLESYYKRLENLIYVGGYQGDNLRAIAALLPTPAEKSAHIARLISVYVAPDARGTGLSKTLIQSLIDIARERGFEQITLNVEATNDPARRLYEKLGFIVYGRHARSIKIDGRYYDEFHMCLDLTAAGA